MILALGINIFAYGASFEVPLTWQKEKLAKAYEIELYADKIKSRLILSRTLYTPYFDWKKENLEPFYMRVRYIDGWDQKSPWSNLVKVTLQSSFKEEKKSDREKKNLKTKFDEYRKSYISFNLRPSALDYEITSDQLELDGTGFIASSFEVDSQIIIKKITSFVLRQQIEYFSYNLADSNFRYTRFSFGLQNPKSLIIKDRWGYFAAFNVIHTNFFELDANSKLKYEQKNLFGFRAGVLFWPDFIKGDEVRLNVDFGQVNTYELSYDILFKSQYDYKWNIGFGYRALFIKDEEYEHSISGLIFDLGAKWEF
jgi:hypothetical protein